MSRKRGMGLVPTDFLATRQCHLAPFLPSEALHSVCTTVPKLHFLGPCASEKEVQKLTEKGQNRSQSSDKCRYVMKRGDWWRAGRYCHPPSTPPPPALNVTWFLLNQTCSFWFSSRPFLLCTFGASVPTSFCQLWGYDAVTWKGASVPSSDV